MTEYERRVARYYQTKLEIHQLDRENAQATFREVAGIAVLVGLLPLLCLAFFIYGKVTGSL